MHYSIQTTLPMLVIPRFDRLFQNRISNKFTLDFSVHLAARHQMPNRATENARIFAIENSGPNRQHTIHTFPIKINLMFNTRYKK